VIAKATKQIHLAGPPLGPKAIAPYHPPKPMVVAEPFEDYKKTGLLFGNHKNHYMKVKPATKRVKPVVANTASSTQRSAFVLPAFLSATQRKGVVPPKDFAPQAPAGSDPMILNMNLDHSDIKPMEEEIRQSIGSRQSSMPAQTNVQRESTSSSTDLDDLPVAESNYDVLGKSLAGTASKNVESEGSSSSEETATSKEVTTEGGSSTVGTEESGVRKSRETTSGEMETITAKNIHRYLPMVELEKLYRKVRSQLVDEVFSENQV